MPASDPIPPRTSLILEHQLAQAGRLSRHLIHELNNQLTGITGYAQLLLQKCEGQPLAKQLDRILQAGERAQTLIENFREATQLYGDREPVALPAALETTVRARRFQIEKRNISISTNIAPNLPTVRANPGHLQLAFGALLDNAYEKLTSVGTGIITVTAQWVDGEIVVEFHDTGGGAIDPPAPWRTTKSADAHAGLGLTLASWVAESLGGRCEVASAPDKATVIRWVIPASEPPKRISA